LQRVLTTVTLLGLLVATAAAFAITEHLKLIKSPVFGTEVSNRAGKPTKLFSPVCHCPNNGARITIRLRHHDHVTVTIVDADSQKVATIASDESVGAHAPQHFIWDGRTADGTRAPDGVYHPWVHLSHARWTGRFTNNITLDTTPPEVLSATGATEGMSLLQRNPDTRLILLDLNLPGGMSGEEWIAWFITQGKQTPVVVASGKGDILTITKGNNRTAALTKPFHMEELQELIEVLLAENWHDQVSVDKKTH
jgi:CheY-like chemotaxis protein